MTSTTATKSNTSPVGVCRWCQVILLGTTVARPDGSLRHLGCR